MSLFKKDLKLKRVELNDILGFYSQVRTIYKTYPQTLNKTPYDQ